MATSMSSYVEQALLDALFNDVDPAALQLSNRYLKLHVGAPGKAGTANAAVETDRKAVTGAASVSGVFTSVNDLIWAGVAATEVYTDVSIWDDPTAGNCLWVGEMVAPESVTGGDTFTMAAGELTVTAD